ncbi:hypothetical protein SNE40_002654 [Patella caerulea]|uniref:Uncharacterized protein n=1 Tax=Patella caerulea TaxID=87958 RepID=A0AAN8K6J2_PATCE
MLQNSIQFINPEMPEAVYGQILSANTGFGGVSPFRRFNGAPGTVFLANNEAPSVPDQHIITSNGGIFTMEAPDVPSFGSAFVSPFSGIGGLSLNGIVASPLNGIDRNVVLQRPGLNRNVVTTRNGPVIIDSAELGHGLRRY